MMRYTVNTTNVAFKSADVLKIEAIERASLIRHSSTGVQAEIRQRGVKGKKVDEKTVRQVGLEKLKPREKQVVKDHRSRVEGKEYDKVGDENWSGERAAQHVEGEWVMKPNGKHLHS